MRKLILGLFGLAVFILPQVAAAQSSNQSFGGDYKYVAKFLCGFVDGNNGVGVVDGHYNTIINVLALKNKTALAYRSTYVTYAYEECSVGDQGAPSDYSERIDLERDEAIGLTCNDIKRQFVEGGCEGFFEGMVTIYSSRPLSVTDVITGQPDDCDGDCDVSVMQVYEVREVKTSEKITPQVLPEAK